MTPNVELISSGIPGANSVRDFLFCAQRFPSRSLSSLFRASFGRAEFVVVSPGPDGCASDNWFRNRR